MPLSLGNTYQESPVKPSSLLVALVLVSACSKVKEINKRTQSMERATEQVSNTTEDLRETTTVMYQQERSREAEATREEKFQILMDDEAELGGRLTAAGVYLQSFEFQLWAGNESFDDQRALERFYLDAVNEFTRRSADLFEKINLRRMSTVRKDKMELSFYALAASLHLNHAFQEEQARKTGRPLVSMYSLIKNALKKEKDRRPLLAHEEVLLTGINKEIMTEFLKARVDILSAFALKNLTDQNDLTLTQRAKALIFRITGGRLGEIDLPEVYQETNAATRTFITRNLDSAVETRQYLRTVSVEKKLERTLESAFKSIDLNESRTAPPAIDQRRQEIRKLIDLLVE